MSQQNKAESTDNFTSDIDATIDNLFAPVKKIEIDPLTNEIREHETVEAQTVRQEEEKKSTDMPELTLPAEAQYEKGHDDKEEFLSLDMEFDLDMEEPEAGESEAVAAECSNDSAEHTLESLSQAIMSLEWEIKEDTINTALDMALAIEKSVQANAVPEADRVLGLVITLLKTMKGKPDFNPATPTMLTRATETLRQCLGPDRNTGPAVKIAEEMEQLVSEEGEGTDHINTVAGAPHLQEVPVTPEADNKEESGHIPELDSDKEEEDLLLMDEDRDATPQHEQTMEPKEDIKAEVEPAQEPAHAPGMESVPEGRGPHAETMAPPRLREEPSREVDIKEAPEIIPETGSAAISRPGTSDQTLKGKYDSLQEIMASLLVELENINTRIIPVEKLLSRTSGMEKLHAFQKDIRTRINRQKDIIESVMEGKGPISGHPGEMDAPGTAGITSQPQETPSKDAKCPWQELMVIDFNGRSIAFPMEELVFAGNIPARSRKKLQKESEFSFAWLKSWPWTKIRPLLSGPLGEKDEKTLKDMQLAVLNPELSDVMEIKDRRDSIKNPVAVILYSETGRAGVIYVEDTPDPLKIKEEQTWTQSPVQKDMVAGRLETGKDTFTVISMSRQDQA